MIVALSLVLILIPAISDALFMWTAPPPAWNQTKPGNHPADIQTAVFRVLKGTTNYQVSWNYSLLEGQSIRFTFFTIRLAGTSVTDDIGDVIGGASTINNRHDYRRRFRLESTSEYSTLTINKVTEREKATFQCKIKAGGNIWAYNVRIEVTVPLKLFNNVSADRTVLESSDLQLYCGASGRPAPNITWIRVFANGSESQVLHRTPTWNIANINRTDAGTYRCTANNGVGNPVSHTLTVNVLFPVKLFNNVSADRTVSQSSDLQLYCGASGRPAPNITWIRVFANGSESQVLHRTPTWNITNINRTDAGTYRCTANNGVGNPVSHTLTVNVLYPSRIVNLPIEYNVAVHQSVALHCRAEGNPDPSFTWTPCNDVCNKSTLIIPEVWNDGVYNCTVTNILGSDSGSTKVVIAGFEINVTLIVTSEGCTDGKYNQFLMLSKKLNEEISKIFVDESAYLRTTVMDVRCGSLIVDLALKFSSTVTEKWVLTMLQDATKNGKLGEFSVNTSSIIGTRVFIQSSLTPLISKSTPNSSEVEECRRCSCSYTILIAASTIFAAIIILLIVYVIWLHQKGTKTGRGGLYAESAGEGNNNNAVEMEVRQPHHIPSWQQTSEVPSQNHYMAVDDERRSNDLPEVTTTTDTSHTSEYAHLNPSTLSREIPRENVTVEKIIGKGAFGQVAKGTVIGLRGRAQMTLVAVKMLKANAPESDRKDLLSELEVMKTLKPHPHVIKLLGYVTESEPLLVLFEYVPYGDLLGYLRKSRGLNDTYYQDPDIKPQTSLTSQQLMKFAWQIADGMSYLSSRSIIHRDLAARNVLVGEKETCKVTDFGMARDVQQENIYERKTTGRLPVKWTPYEALMYGTYTTKSDVWSYGVLLYEIFTIGGSPYPQMDMANIASLLHQGYRMPKPQHVDEELYKIMTTCWEEEPDVRPTFAELRNKLKKMENRHKRLINMKMYDTQLYANVEDLVM